MDFNDIYKLVQELPQFLRDSLVIKLLVDEKVSYDAVSAGYIQYIQKLKREQTEEYNQLQYRTTRVYTDFKKNRDKNIDECIRFLAQKRRINLPEKELIRLKVK